jgi:Transposase
MSQTTSGSSQEDAPIKYICGIDVGSQSCSGCVCRPDKSVVVKPVTFANAKEGWEVLFEKLSRLDAVPKQILIGMEATSRYGENLYQEAQARLSALFVASWPNASVSPAARVACQDRSARCHDHRQGVVEWGSAGGLCAQRADHHVSRIGAFAYPLER